MSVACCSPLRWHSAGGGNVYVVGKSKASDKCTMAIKWNQSNVFFGG